MMQILLCALTKQAVGLQEVVQEAITHVGVQEKITGEQRTKRFHLVTVNLSKRI